MKERTEFKVDKLSSFRELLKRFECFKMIKKHVFRDEIIQIGRIGKLFVGKRIFDGKIRLNSRFFLGFLSIFSMTFEEEEKFPTLSLVRAICQPNYRDEIVRMMIPSVDDRTFHASTAKRFDQFIGQLKV